MSAVLCFDCGVPMERVSARRRSGRLTEDFRCPNCQGKHQRVTAAAGESAADRKAAQKQLDLTLQRFESAWRGKWRSKSPLDGWTLKHDGRRKGWLLIGKQGVARYFSRDLDDLREGMYEALGAGELTPLALFAIDERGNGALRRGKVTADAVRAAERVIANRAAALDQDDERQVNRSGACVTDKPLVAATATQTRFTPSEDNRAVSRSAGIVTDNQAEPVKPLLALLESDESVAAAELPDRDSGAFDEGESDPPNPDNYKAWFLAGRYKVGDRVIVKGAPELPGEVIDLDRAGGRICVRRPNPDGKSKMTHWVSADRIAAAPAADDGAAAAPMNATARGASSEDKTRVNRVVMRDVTKRKTSWRECAECGRLFRAGRADAKTCSTRCRKLYSRRDNYIRYHGAALEDALNRLLELAQKYPDQRGIIEHKLMSARHQLERVEKEIKRINSMWDKPNAL
jgi:hypothetical protein